LRRSVRSAGSDCRGLRPVCPENKIAIDTIITGKQ
jgi:hypothetical protein